MEKNVLGVAFNFQKAELFAKVEIFELADDVYLLKSVLLTFACFFCFFSFFQ